MNTFVRWAVVVVAVLVVVGLIAYARGPEHQRGDEVGAVEGAAVGSAAVPG